MCILPQSKKSNSDIYLPKQHKVKSVVVQVAGGDGGRVLKYIPGGNVNYVNLLESSMATFLSFFLFLFYFLLYFWLHCIFVAVHGLPLVAASGGYSSLQSTGSRCTGFSSCVTQAQQLWRTGLVAPHHVGSSRNRAQTHVPCIGRWVLNHCSMGEVPGNIS